MTLLARLASDLSDFVEGLLDCTGAPGFSLALASPKETFTGAWGQSRPHLGEPFSARTVIRTGSMAKLYVSAAVMTLVEAGVISLDEPASAYLPFTVRNPIDGTHPTLTDLLRHRSGLMANYGYPSDRRSRNLTEHLRDVFERGRGDAYGGVAPLWSAGVGERMQYTNTGAALLGLIVERTHPDGLSFADFVEQHVFEPLGMTDTSYEDVRLEDRRADLSERLATGYMKLGPEHFPSPRLWIHDYPAGAAVTTPADHAKLLLAYLPSNANSLLSRHSIEQSLHVPDAPHGGWGVGLLWQRGNIGTGHEYFGHNGGHMWAFTNSSRCWPRHGVVLVTAANHWDLAEGAHRPRCLEAEYCNAFVDGWLATAGAGWTARAASDPDSARSYVMGVVLADRIGPRLGLRPDPSVIEHILTNRLTASTHVQIDENALRAGFVAVATRARDDLAHVPQAIESGAGLDPTQAHLMWRSLGGLTGRPLLAM